MSHKLMLNLLEKKEDLFDKWLTSKKVENNFDKLRQLLLLEELLGGGLTL